MDKKIKMFKFVTVLILAGQVSGCAVINRIPSPEAIGSTQGADALMGWMRIGVVAIEAYKAVQEARGEGQACKLPPHK